MLLGCGTLIWRANATSGPLTRGTHGDKRYWNMRVTADDISQQARMVKWSHSQLVASLS